MSYLVNLSLLSHRCAAKGNKTITSNILKTISDVIVKKKCV